MRKIVVLNSGGFDSTVLIKYLRREDENCEIHSLHFLYGARNEKEQLSCMQKVCEEVKAIIHTIKLPEFKWSNSNFYNEGYEFNSQYLEYRNLIFISYALSLAESIGAKEIFLATLKSVSYADTSELFFKGLNSFSMPLSDIEIKTPFADVESKDQLIPLATATHIKVGDYFSCDVPVNGKPCGKCNDCKALERIEEALKEDFHFKRFLNTGGDYEDTKFKELLVSTPIEEMRVLHNNKCQLKCAHCFYGFDEPVSPILPKEVIYDAIVQASKLGIKNIHFSGKEPLFDDEILWYAHKIKEDHLPLTFNLVTNGINLPKYVKELKECGMNRVFLSVDEVLNSNGVRSVHNVCEKAIQSSFDVGMPVEIFIDLHHNNVGELKDIVEYLLSKYPKGIEKFYIRTIRSLGRASNGSNLLSGAELDSVFIQLVDISEEYKDVNFQFTMGIEMEQKAFLETVELSKALELMDSYRTMSFKKNFMIYVESYCSRYGSTITLTPDGYLLGCASEVAVQNYNEISAGNIKDHSLAELIKIGKLKLKNINDVYANCGDCKKCSFLM